MSDNEKQEIPAQGPALSETQTLIAETLRVPLDSTVRDEFTPRQKALLSELEAMQASLRKAEKG